MRRNGLIAAIAAALFSATAVAHLGDGPQGSGYGYGYGMGRGAMHGWGGGPGQGAGACMDPAAMVALGLTAEQREKIASIQKEVSAKQLELVTSMREIRAKALASGEPATARSHEAIADLRKQMFELTRQSRERVDAVLTAEQRAQWRPGWRGFASRG